MINSENWQKFTVYGSGPVEDLLKNMALISAERFSSVFGNKLKALILLGGYGRGEGGIVVEDGKEKPHNNFDLLLVSDGSEIEAEANELSLEIEAEIDFSLDISVLSEKQLANLSPRVIWYDMAKGHKVLFGADNYLEKFAKFSLNDVPSWDFRNLMINRGTLLVINDLLLREAPKSEKLQKTLIKHLVKGIIGYGDALLYFKGKYHWSYVKKLQNMNSLGGVRENFRTLYQLAAEFRLKSDYSLFKNKDISEWMTELKPLLADVFLEVESLRIQDDVDWDCYLESFYSTEFRQSSNYKEWLKKIRNLIRGEVKTGKTLFSFEAKLGIRSGGKEALSACLFPMAAFDVQKSAYKSFFSDALSLNDKKQIDWSKEYLKVWSQVADKSLPKLLNSFGVSLESKK